MNLLHSFQSALAKGVSYLQHLVMRVAVAASLKLCMFTARVLMDDSEHRQANQF